MLMLRNEQGIPAAVQDLGSLYTGTQGLQAKKQEVRQFAGPELHRKSGPRLTLWRWCGTR